MVGKGLYLSISSIRHRGAISTTISVAIDLRDISCGGKAKPTMESHGGGNEAQGILIQ